MSNLISPVDCKHRHTSLLQAGSTVSTEEHSRYRITLCRDCGQFMVRGMMNEEYYSIDFTLIRKEDLEAAGKAVAYYSEGDDGDGHITGYEAIVEPGQGHEIEYFEDEPQNHRYARFYSDESDPEPDY